MARRVYWSPSVLHCPADLWQPSYPSPSPPRPKGCHRCLLPPPQRCPATEPKLTKPSAAPTHEARSIDSPSSAAMADDDTYVLEITQSWRGKDYMGNIMPLHWAITAQTGGTDRIPTGHIYNAAGNIDTFFYEELHDTPLRNANWRGTLAVCTIPKDRLPDVERMFARVPVIRQDRNWNCQNWVHAALRELKDHEFDVKVVSWEGLKRAMNELLEAWENGDI
ncbi:hypothetical protein WOLCODRAFT_147648 [Wolfiporia cocos MD-104 SS10]|uniref:Uncharacterized protein n=1 Tax=Wolfiporia cocos (strain MD-104) TaxID=742152 RepID=A0A2H3JC75_WOLCO|nr:hypothetical protein WOLCODRAFT_147648 [Wolfiporia cocos MD-104 SS10]